MRRVREEEEEEGEEGKQDMDALYVTITIMPILLLNG